MIDSFAEMYNKDYGLIEAENVYTSLAVHAEPEPYQEYLTEPPLEDDLAIMVGDGNDWLLHENPAGVPEDLRVMANRNSLAASQTTATLVVPFPRILKRTSTYMRGKDVLAVQRALAKAGLRKWGTFTYAYGDGTKRQVQKFQGRVGLVTDGVYGAATHAKLARYFDAYGAYLMTQQAKTLAVQSPRDKIKAAAVFGYNKRSYIHYTQSSLRMYGVKHRIKPPNIPIYEDCSSFSTWAYWVASRPDPNGLGYNGYGYTGTLAAHGLRTFTPRVGDLAFYGYYPYSHVVVYIGGGRCISHGNEYGPQLLSVYYRPVSHFRSYIN